MKKVFLISITVIFCALMLPAESYWEEYASGYDPSMTLPSFGENQITANGDSLNCRLLGRPMFGSCGCATAKGEYAFAGFGYSMLSFEISTPSNPVMVDYFELGRTVMDIIVKDSFAFLGVWAMGLRVVDISDPADLKLSGEYNVFKYVNDINIFDTILVMAEDNASVTVLNVKDPYNPVRITAFSTAAAVQEAWLVDDTLVYTAEMAIGMRIYNISDTLSAVLVGQYNTAGSARGVTVKDTIAYVSDFTGGVVVLNVSNPASPSLIYTYNDPGAAYTLAIEDTLALLTDDTGGLRILNIKDPLSIYEVSYFDSNSIIRFVSHVDSFILAQDFYEGMIILDASDLTSLEFLSNHDEGNSITKIDAVDTFLYAAMGSEGFAVMNVADPMNSFMSGEAAPGGTVGDIKVEGNYAYVANASLGLQIVDISDKSNMFVAKTVPLGNYPRAVDVLGNYAYVAADTGGLKIIDISDPLNAYLVSTCGTPGKAMGLCVRDTLVFVADYDSGMSIINVASSLSPSRIGFYDTPSGYAYNVAVHDTFAIMSDHWEGFRVFGISDPKNPNLLATYNTNGYAYDVVIDWPLLYVSDDTEGLRIFSILNPALPVEIGYYDTYGNAQGLDFQDSTVYVAEFAAGVTLLNYTKPLTFTLSGTVGLDQNPADSSGTLVRGIEFAQSCSTDASGRYQFDDMLEGTYTLIFEHQGYHPDTMTAVFTGYETFNTTLDYIELYTMKGTVGLLDNPADSSGTYVFISEISRGDSTDSSGGYSIDSVPEGDYTLTATHDGYKADTASLIFTGTESYDAVLVALDLTPPSPFSLISPSGDFALTVNPYFYWHASSDAALKGYRLYVDDSMYTDTPDTEWVDLFNPLSEGTHFWYVIARDTSGNERQSNETDTFRLDITPPPAPALSSPADAGFTSENEIAWHPSVDNVSGTFYYNAFIDDDSLFGSVNEMGDIEDTLYQFSLLEGRYFWKVMAYDSFDNMGAWSQAWSFRYDTTGPSAPVLSNPPDDSYISGNSLAWHPATDNLTGISRYTVEIDNDSLFGSINVSEDSEETLYAFSLLEGVYYWRVMAYDSSENPGAWSSVWSFEYDGSMPIVPLPLSPVNDSALTDTLVNFWVMSSYKSSNEAKSGDDNVKYSPVHYIINVDTVRDLSSPIFIDTFDTEYGSGIFKDERRYYWSARAYDEAGNQGFESPADSFRIDYTYPSTPVLLSPSDSAITSASLFIWNSSTDNYSGVQYYELVYDDDSLFASPETLTTADTTQNPVLTDGRYYWRVRAVDNFDNTGEWASKQMFDYDNTPPSSPSLASPLDKTTSSSSTFVWHAASDNFTGVREYTLWYDDDSLFGSANTVSTADTFHTATLSDLVYYWRVSSSDNAYNVSSWSDVWSFDYSPAGISEKFIIDTKDKEETSIRVNLNGVRFTTISSESEFFVYDITGKIVYSAAKNKTGRHFYSTDNLSSGIYFVKLKDEEKEIKRKIVILR